MKAVDSILILVVAFVAVFFEAAFAGFRHLTGAQFHFLPALMVYAALRSGLATIGALAVLGGMWFDALSSNLFGVTILPLFIVGFLIYIRRDLILQTQVFAQSVLGAVASLIVPTFTLLILLTARENPLLGWGTLWQFIVMGAVGAALAPAFFILFGWIEKTFMYSDSVQTSFRPDREIRRGR